MRGLDVIVLHLFDFLIYKNRVLFAYCETWLEDANFLVDFVHLSVVTDYFFEAFNLKTHTGDARSDGDILFI